MLVKKILHLLNRPESLIEFVEDRKGHDFRYAMNFAKAEKELGWKPKHTVDQLCKEMVDSDIRLFKRDKYLLDGGHEVTSFNE